MPMSDKVLATERETVKQVSQDIENINNSIFAARSGETKPMPRGCVITIYTMVIMFFLLFFLMERHKF